MRFGSRQADRWLLIILVVGAVLRFVPVWFGLPYRARPDEEVAVAIALRALDGNLNPEFFHWPSLTFYVFAGVFGAARTVKGLLGFGETIATEHYFLLGRIVVATAGTATLLVLYRLGRRAAGEPAGLVAAAALAVAVLHVRDSHFAMTDVLMTLLSTASLALILEGLAAPSPSSARRWFAAAGLAGGLAAATKYNAAAVGIGMLAAQGLLFRGDWRGALRPASWLPLALFSAAFGAAFLAATPYAILDTATFWADLQFTFSHLAEGHGVNLGRGWTSHLMRSLPFGLGPAMFAAALLGVVPLGRHHGRAAIVLGSFAAALYLSIGSGYTVFFRYIMPLLPALCLSAAVGLLHGAGWLAARTRLSCARALALLLVVTVGPGLVNSAWFDVLLARTDSRILAAHWLDPRLEPGTTVYDSGGDYASLDLLSPYHGWQFDPESGSFGDPLGRTPEWLVLHESPVSVYASTPPQVRAIALRHYRLVHTVHATRGRARSAVYDLQDAFFMPLWGFWTVERPGPTIQIYRLARPPS